ncbi:MAG: hypothetical protein ABSF64_10990 [Bryobacteraceae bacterium]
MNRTKRLWFIFYAALTLAAVLPAAALMTIAFQSLGHSAWAEQLGRRLDMEWIGELIAAYGGMPMGLAVAAMAGVLAISALVHVFLLGGAIEMFAKRQWFSAGVFFGGCGRNFWRLFRLALYCLIPLAAVVGINIGLAAIGEKIWGKGSEAAPLIYWSWFRAGVMLLLLGFVNMVFDYTAIRLVADDSRKAFRGMWRTFRFVWTHLARTAGLAVVLWAVMLGLVAAYFGISQMFSQQSVGAVLLLLLVRQVLVIGRIWSRLLFYASQCEMYDGLAAAAAPVSVSTAITAVSG